MANERNPEQPLTGQIREREEARERRENEDRKEYQGQVRPDPTGLGGPLGQNKPPGNRG